MYARLLNSELTCRKLSDVIGRRPVVFMAFVVESLAIGMSGWANSEHLWAIFIVMFLFGLADSMFNTQLNSILPVLQPERTQAAFGCAIFFI